MTTMPMLKTSPTSFSSSLRAKLIFFYSVMYLALLVTFFATGRVASFALDAKIDLPSPTMTSLVSGTGSKGFEMDSSLSPQIIKAFYEINFIPTSNHNSHKNIVTLSDRSDCVYSKELCKYLYFVPSKISLVKEVESLIQENIRGDVPVIQGLVSKEDEKKFMKEVNNTVDRVIHLKKNQSDDVPVYKGTVQTQEILKKPEHIPMPYYPGNRGPYRNDNNWKATPCHSHPCNRNTPFYSPNPYPYNL